MLNTKFDLTPLKKEYLVLNIDVTEEYGIHTQHLTIKLIGKLVNFYETHKIFIEEIEAILYHPFDYETIGINTILKFKAIKMDIYQHEPIAKLFNTIVNKVHTATEINIILRYLQEIGLKFEYAGTD